MRAEVSAGSPRNSIIDFWSGLDRRETVHPSDKPVIERVGTRDLILDRYLPQPFMGPLKTARIVLLYLSPGISDTDANELTSEAEIARCERQRSGIEPMPGVGEHPNAWRWWSSRAKWLGNPELLRIRIAIFELGAYHSKDGYHDLLLSLPSTRAAVDWAQTMLFPDAISGNKLVLCLRAPRYWGLRAGQRYGMGLFAPATTRNGYIADRPIREEILTVARSFG